MSEKDLMDKIQAHAAELPKVRNVTDVYVKVMAPLVGKLTPDELDAVIELGALVDDRATRMVPILRWDQIGDMGEGRPIV